MNNAILEHRLPLVLDPLDFIIHAKDDILLSFPLFICLVAQLVVRVV